MTLAITHAALAADANDRYHRQSLIGWWEQTRVAAARVLVIGAGALGNEILKLLGLIGAGRILVYDPDHIERSNLSRCVLFRDADEGQGKADVAVRRVVELNPDVRALARPENVIERAGLGVFAWADVVIGGVDNREARVFVNSACARTGKPWVDGAIEGLSGVVRVFDPATTACYECTMNATDRRLLAERRSCAMLARSAVAQGHVPTSAVAASIIGAMQVQEAMKLLHGQPALHGEGLFVNGLHGDVSRVGYSRREDCLGHEQLGPLTPLGRGAADITLRELLDRADADLGGGAELALSRDVVASFACPDCGTTERVGQPLGAVREAQARCPACGVHRVPEIASSVARDGAIDLALTPAELGVPRFDVIVARRGLDAEKAYLLDADAAQVLGDLM